MRRFENLEYARNPSWASKRRRQVAAVDSFVAFGGLDELRGLCTVTRLQFVLCKDILVNY